MTGVVQWSSGGIKRRCHDNYNFGTPKITTWTVSMRNLLHFTVFMFLLLSIMMTPNVSGQRRQQSTRHQSTRRPNGSPALEAYRNRLMAYMKQKEATSTTPRAPAAATVGLRVGSDSKNVGTKTTPPAPVINGFPCERTYAFFPSQTNPRMYHLCARSRENWHVYHYFCPHGTVFSDGMGKCMQDRREGNENGGNGINNNLPANTRRRPTNNVSNPRITRRPPVPVLRRTTTSTTTTSPTIITSTTSTEATTSTSTTTTEESEPIPEPDSNHTGVTDHDMAASSSSEEASTEDGKDIDVMVSLPSTAPQQSSDEWDVYQPINENEASNEIPESVNEQSRLVAAAAVTTPASAYSSSVPTKQKQQTLLKRVPLKAIQGVVAAANTAAAEDAEMGNGFSSTKPLDQRRPRLLKKIKYLRDFLIGDQNL